MSELKRSCLSLSAYVTAHAVSRFLSNERERRRAISQFRNLGITKVYEEFYRSGFLVEEPVLRRVKGALERAGFEVSGGIATTHGGNFTKEATMGWSWICYTSPKSRHNLREAMVMAASIFDEIIVDDFLCTACRCGGCRRQKGRRDWRAFYRDLMVDFSASCLIDPAKKVNPSIRLIIKYPQWYDRFHVFGYDVGRQIKAFDAVWVGTEIRDPRIEFVHQYEPFANYSYLASVGGTKVSGAWFDYYNCYPEIYLEQAYQSILAGAPELVLFCYDPVRYDTRDPNTEALIGRRSFLEGLCEALKGRRPIGIEAYKPQDSDPAAESFLFDYLGVMGLPVLVTADPPRGKAVLLSAHALHDPLIEERVQNLPAGSTVLATSGFLEGLESSSLPGDLFGLGREPIARRNLFGYRFAVEGSEHLAENRVLLRSYLQPSRARVVAEMLERRSYPILTVNEVAGTTYLAACMDTFRYMPYHGPAKVTAAEPVSLIHLPQGYLDRLRELVLVPLGLTFRAPSRVGVYLYCGKTGDQPEIIAVENFGDQAVEVKLGHFAELSPRVGGAALRPEGTLWTIRLPRRDLALLAPS